MSELTTSEVRVRGILVRGAREAYGAPDPEARCEACGGLPALDPEECGNTACPSFACPDCSARWDTQVQPCPGCGLTIEDVAERVAARSPA